jgi:hypothetical protein
MFFREHEVWASNFAIACSQVDCERHITTVFGWGARPVTTDCHSPPLRTTSSARADIVANIATMKIIDITQRMVIPL